MEDEKIYLCCRDYARLYVEKEIKKKDRKIRIEKDLDSADLILIVGSVDNKMKVQVAEARKKGIPLRHVSYEHLPHFKEPQKKEVKRHEISMDRGR